MSYSSLYDIMRSKTPPPKKNDISAIQEESLTPTKKQNISPVKALKKNTSQNQKQMHKNSKSSNQIVQYFAPVDHKKVLSQQSQKVIKHVSKQFQKTSFYSQIVQQKKFQDLCKPDSGTKKTPALPQRRTNNAQNQIKGLVNKAQDSIYHKQAKNKADQQPQKEEIVKRQQTNLSPTSMPLVSNLLSNNFQHTEKSAVQTVLDRLQKQLVFTQLGDMLISINTQNAELFTKEIKNQYTISKDSKLNKPHIFQISRKAWDQITQKSQSIVLLGKQQGGKTFNMIQLLDHLIILSGSEFISNYIQAGIQILHVLTSYKSNDNYESSAAAFKINIGVDVKKQFESIEIDAKILDATLPRNKNGRTFQILHSILYLEENQLTKLGLQSDINYKILQNKSEANSSQNQVSIDTVILDHFLQNLDFFQLNKNLKQNLLQTLAGVILIGELEITKAGSENIKIKNQQVANKLCKILKMSELELLQIFKPQNMSDQFTWKLQSLAKIVYNQVVSYMVEYINNFLDQQFALKSQQGSQQTLQIQNQSSDKVQENLLSARNKLKYRYISIYDFPGFREDNTLGGFLLNSASEILQTGCSLNLTNILNILQQEQLEFQHFQLPQGENIVDILFSQDHNFLNCIQSSDRYLWKQLSEKLEQQDLDQTISILQNTLSINFTFGRINFDKKQLKEELQPFQLKLSRTSKNQNVFLQSSKQKQQVLKYEAKLIPNEVLNMIKPISETQIQLVYCFPGQQANNVQILTYWFRNSLIQPSLI